MKKKLGSCRGGTTAEAGDTVEFLFEKKRQGKGQGDIQIRRGSTKNEKTRLAKRQSE